MDGLYRDDRVRNVPIRVDRDEDISTPCSCLYRQAVELYPAQIQKWDKRWMTPNTYTIYQALHHNIMRDPMDRSRAEVSVANDYKIPVFPFVVLWNRR